VQLVRRPFAAVISLIAAAAIALPTVTVLPAHAQVSGVAAPRVSTESIQLTAGAFEQIWAIATGADSDYPLPAGAHPIAPIAEQLGNSLLSYGRQLLTGQGGLIPAEISAQVARVQATGSPVNALLVDDVVIVGLSAFSAVFLTGIVVLSLPASSSSLPSLPGIWLNGLLLPVLKWTYNAFAIRNAIATALQPTTALPVAVATTAPAVVPEPTTARAVPSRPLRTTSKASASAKGAVGSTTPPTKKAAAAATQRSAPPISATGKAGPPKSGPAAHQRPRHR
jgi:hypothetical protein